MVDFTKSCKSKISRKCEFQPIKCLEITLTITLTINLRLTITLTINLRLTITLTINLRLTITLTINLRLTTFCEIDPLALTHHAPLNWQVQTYTYGELTHMSVTCKYTYGELTHMSVTCKYTYGELTHMSVTCKSHRHWWYILGNRLLL